MAASIAPLPSDDLLTALRAATRSLHANAERGGFVHELLKGRATRAGYALWLRNLWPGYDALETALSRLRAVPAYAGIGAAAVFRAPALERDLSALCGAAWRRDVPELPAGAAYAERIRSVAADPGRLIAHAYVRYLGDLNGGLVVRRVVAASLALEADALHFYAFPDAPATLEAAYRRALAVAGRALGDAAAAADEAVLAFRLNIALSEAVLTAA